MEYRKKIEKREQSEVVVCGGGFSGFAAAYAAAREGKKVLLVERNYILGGVGTSSLVNHILGVRYRENDGVYTCVKGIFSLLEEKLLKEGGAVDYRSISPDYNPHGWKPSLGTGLIFDNEKMKLLLEQMLLDVGVRILYGTDIVDVIRKGDLIDAILVHNKTGLFLIEGEVFVDATGDGDVCAMAGCEYRQGDEEGLLAAASLEMHVENVDLEELGAYMRESGDLRFVQIISRLKEEGIWNFPYEIFISVLLTKPGVFMINTIRQTNIDGTDGNSVTKGVLEGRKENFELLEIMRKHFPGFQKATVRSIAPTIGIRETRRFVCDYTLTVKDLIEAVPFEDSIALSSYSWDLPHPKNPSYQPYRGVKRKSRITEIPYRCLIPKGTENVILAGRSIGVEREVMGPVRVMGPCLAMGEAAGIAASLAPNGHFRDVSVSRLQEKIRFHQGLTRREAVLKD